MNEWMDDYWINDLSRNRYIMSGTGDSLKKWIPPIDHMSLKENFVRLYTGKNTRMKLRDHKSN